MSSRYHLPKLEISSEQFETMLGTTFENQLPNLPEDVRFCVRCVISNQRPRILLDEEGICSACRYWEEKPLIDWDARQDHLSKILNEHRNSAGRYDVVVPGSGGKDSAYVAHQLKTRWGMHPLTVTWAPHAYTEIGRLNLDAFIQSGFDNLAATPNGLLHRKLTLLSTVTVGDNFLPFIWGQIAYAFHVAQAFDIPLIFFGENGEAEYGGSKLVRDLPGMPVSEWAENYWKGVTAHALMDFGTSLQLISEEERQSISRFYFPPKLDTPNAPQHFWYGYFTEWRPQDNYYYCSELTGFVANPEGRSEGTYSKYASLDDRLDGFHYLFGLLKFGLGRATSDAAHEIREGLITREEGVALVRKYDMEFPKRNYQFFLDYVGLTDKQFASVMNKFRSQHLWERKDDEWTLKYPVWCQ